jgi:hypothetical protein
LLIISDIIHQNKYHVTNILVVNLHENKNGRPFYFNRHMTFVDVRTIVGERVKQIRGNVVQFKALFIVGT